MYFRTVLVKYIEKRLVNIKHAQRWKTNKMKTMNVYKDDVAWNKYF